MKSVWLAIACASLVAASAAAEGAVPGTPAPGHAAAAATKATPEGAARVDINSAAPASLETLPGIGEAEARKIVAGRPWRTKADLVLKGVIPEGTYVAIRHRIVAANPAGPPAKK